MEWVSQAETAKRCSIRQPMTISMWKRDPRFEEWVAEGLRIARIPVIEAAKLAIALRTIQGNARFGALLLQQLGYDGFAGDEASMVQAAGAQATATASVVFVGLPQPPSPQEAEARRPPNGSNLIIPAQTVPQQLPAAVRP